MKAKYYLEQFDSYYPGGGRADLEGPFDTMAEAQKAINPRYDFSAVLVIENNEIRECCTWEDTHWDYTEAGT